MKKILKIKLDPNSFVSKFEETYSKNACQKTSIMMEKYMRNKFKFYGHPSPARNKLYSEVLNQYQLENLTRETLHQSVQLCFDSDKREMTYTGMDLIRDLWQKDLCEQDLTFLEKLIIQGKWWDTTDLMSPYFGIIFKNNKDLISTYNVRYLNHEDMWMRRISLIFQLRYKDQMDQKLLFENIKALWHEEDFFIKKAIGWALREHSKWETKAVVDFVQQNESKLSHLSKVEALKYVDKRKIGGVYKGVEIPQYQKKSIG